MSLSTRSTLVLTACVLLCVPQSFSMAQVPTWSQDVAPIIYNHCTSCHRSGEIAPFPLTNYAETVAWADMISYVTQIRYMPPWKADASYGVEYLDENALSDEQIATIKRWVEGGSPEGDPALAPALPVFPTGSQVGTPDLVLSFSQSFTHKGNGKDQYRYFVLPTGLTEDKDLVALEMRPGNTKIVHHTLFWADASGTAAAMDKATPEYGYGFGDVQGSAQTEFGDQLPGYVPGQRPRVLTHGLAQRVPAGSDLVLQMHYAPSPIDETDSTVVNLFFADEPASRHVRSHIMLPNSLVNGPFIIPPNTVREFHGQFTVPFKVSGVGIAPHCHLLGRNWRVFAVTPSRDTIPLIHIEDWDFNWQGTYYFRKLKVFPAGTTIHAFATYDNTTNNPFNPNSPPAYVTWGEGTSDEMFYLPLLWVPYQSGDEAIDFAPTPTSVGDPRETDGGERFHFNTTRLYPVAPNPARGSVTIGFTLAASSRVSLGIYDIQGRCIATLIDNRPAAPGQHVVTWDASSAPSGAYTVALHCEGAVHSQRIVVE